MHASSSAVTHEQAGLLATEMVGIKNDGHLSNPLALRPPQRDMESAPPWGDMVDKSAFLTGMYKDCIDNLKDLEIFSKDTKIDVSERWNLNAKFRIGDRRHGIDIDWPFLDPRINSTYGNLQRQFFAKLPQYQSEQPFFSRKCGRGQRSFR
jgi:hypothetical protein